MSVINAVNKFKDKRQKNIDRHTLYANNLGLSLIVISVKNPDKFKLPHLSIEDYRENLIEEMNEVFDSNDIWKIKDFASILEKELISITSTKEGSIEKELERVKSSLDIYI